MFIMFVNICSKLISMSRPKRFRRIGFPPVLKGFKPIGVPFINTGVISILYEEYEAFRLCDYEGLSQEDAAKAMNVSRPTLTRIIDSCQKKIAQAFVEGKSMIIDGGNVEFDKQWYRCNDCHFVFHLSKNKKPECPQCKSVNIDHINENIRNWRKGNFRNQDEILTQRFCVCPNCNYEEPHERGKPCFSNVCPNCNVPLVRRDK